MKKDITEATQSPVYITNDAERLIAQAIDKNIPVETMERLLAMRREMKAEAAKEAYDSAMARFQADCPTIEKKTKGYNYKYADLTTIVEQVKSLLSDNGFSYTFDTDEIENKIIIFCMVKHIAGHMEVIKAVMSKDTTAKMNASQQSGAAMTYGKRYAFCNAFGILTGDEDTDARTAPGEKPREFANRVHSESVTPVRETDDSDIRQVYDDVIEAEDVPIVEAKTKTPPALITNEQKIQIMSLLGKKGKTLTDLDKATASFKVRSYKDLTATNAALLIKRMEQLPDVATADTVDPDEAEEGITQMRLSHS